MDKNLPALMRTDTKTIMASFFQPEQSGGPEPFQVSQLVTESKQHMFVTDQALLAGELILVLQSGLPRIAVIKEVHATVQIPPGADKEYKWVLARVNLNNYYKNITRNDKILAIVRAGYNDSTKADFTNNMLAALPGDARTALLEELAKNV